MTVERRISFLGREIRKTVLKPRDEVELEIPLSVFGRFRSLIVLSGDSVQLNTTEAPSGQTEVKTLERETINLSGLKRGRLFKTVFGWKPSGEK